MVRDSIKAFDPMLRSVYDSVDLKKLVTAEENSNWKLLCLRITDEHVDKTSQKRPERYLLVVGLPLSASVKC